MEIAADVAQVMAYLVTVVVSAVADVAVHSCAPLSSLRKSFARGNIVPQLEDLLIHSENVTDPSEGMVPPRLGTPVCVSNRFTSTSEGETFFMSDEAMAIAAASGPAVFNWSRTLLVADTSLWRWYIAVCAHTSRGAHMVRTEPMTKDDERRRIADLSGLGRVAGTVIVVECRGCGGGSATIVRPMHARRNYNCSSLRAIRRRSSLCHPCTAVFERSETTQSSKVSTELTRAAIANHAGDLLHAEAIASQQDFGFLDSTVMEVVIEAQPRLLFQQPARVPDRQ